MVSHGGANWKLAESLIVLEAEANLFAPNRNKASDGSIGDQAHASRHSFHNPDQNGYVRALDLTNSASTGFDAVKVANLIAQRVILGQETRVQGIGSWNYQTSSNRWFSQHGGTVWSWQDQQLAGASHITHMHIEVTIAGYTDLTPWGLYKPVTPVPVPPPLPKEPTMFLIHVSSNGATAVTDGIYWRPATKVSAQALQAAGVQTITMSDTDMRAAFIEAK